MLRLHHHYRILFTVVITVVLVAVFYRYANTTASQKAVSQPINTATSTIFKKTPSNDQATLVQSTDATPGLTGNGASISAVVPETPFNSTHPFLATLPNPSDIPFTPEQRALTAGAIIALGITLSAFYIWRIGVHR